MTWDELLEEYRSLGGVAENVRLGHGNRGRGVFAIDPNEPAVLRTPPSMYVPVESIVVRDAAMTSTAETLGARERQFFDDYQRYFGWGAGGYEESREMQTAWHGLPDDVIAAVSNVVVAGAHWRFAAPGIEACQANYLLSRCFRLAGRSYMVPMIDLVNHSSDAAPYGTENGFSVSGTFEGEMLVSYNTSDPLGHVFSYGFAAESPYAYSLGVSVSLPQSRTLSIAREITVTAAHNRLQLPKVATAGAAIHLPFLLLGFKTAMDLPRAAFRKTAVSFAGAIEADRIFEGIQQYNWTQLIQLLRLVRGHGGSLIRTLETALIGQLDALSACVGARAL